MSNSKKLRNRILSNLKLVEGTFKVTDKEEFIKNVGNSVGRTLTELIFNKEFITAKNKIKYENDIPECLLNAKKNNKPT